MDLSSAIRARSHPAGQYMYSPLSNNISQYNLVANYEAMAFSIVPPHSYEYFRNAPRLGAKAAFLRAGPSPRALVANMLLATLDDNCGESRDCEGVNVAVNVGQSLQLSNQTPSVCRNAGFHVICSLIPPTPHTRHPVPLASSCCIDDQASAIEPQALQSSFKQKAS